MLIRPSFTRSIGISELRRPSKLRPRSGIRDTATITEGILHIIERQDSRAGIVASLVDKVDRHTSTCTTTMLQDGIGQWANLLETQRCSLREKTDAAGLETNVATDGEGATEAVILGASFSAESDCIGLADTNDVVTGVVRGRVVFWGGPDGVAEDLDDLGVAAGCCTVAECWATAVDTEGRGSGEESGEGAEAEESRCKMHCALLNVDLSWCVVFVEVVVGLDCWALDLWEQCSDDWRWNVWGWDGEKNENFGFFYRHLLVCSELGDGKVLPVLS